MTVNAFEKTGGGGGVEWPGEKGCRWWCGAGWHRGRLHLWFVYVCVRACARMHACVSKCLCLPAKMREGSRAQHPDGVYRTSQRRRGERALLTYNPTFGGVAGGGGSGRGRGGAEPRFCATEQSEAGRSRHKIYGFCSAHLWRSAQRMWKTKLLRARFFVGSRVCVCAGLVMGASVSV